MLTDADFQSMKIDGVDVDLFKTNQSLFQYCPSCHGSFQTQITNLLNCGHFCCDLCMGYIFPCGYCKAPKKLKTANYICKLSKSRPESSSDRKQEFWDIVISISANNKVKFIKKVSNLKKVIEVLRMSNEFLSFEQGLQQLGRILIVIQSKPCILSKVMDKKLCELPILPLQGGGIMFSIADRYLGASEIK